MPLLYMGVGGIGVNGPISLSRTVGSIGSTVLFLFAALSCGTLR